MRLRPPRDRAARQPCTANRVEWRRCGCSRSWSSAPSMSPTNTSLFLLPVEKHGSRALPKPGKAPSTQTLCLRSMTTTERLLHICNLLDAMTVKMDSALPKTREQRLSTHTPIAGRHHPFTSHQAAEEYEPVRNTMLHKVGNYILEHKREWIDGSVFREIGGGNGMERQTRTALCLRLAHRKALSRWRSVGVLLGCAP